MAGSQNLRPYIRCDPIVSWLPIFGSHRPVIRGSEPQRYSPRSEHIKQVLGGISHRQTVLVFMA